jgi:hypothetical protein
MTRTKSLLAATGVGLSALLVTTSAKAFIVFAPAAFVAVVVGSVLFGGLVGGAAVNNYYATTYPPPPPPATVYVTRPGAAPGCYPATVRIHHVIHHVQVCD